MFFSIPNNRYFRRFLVAIKLYKLCCQSSKCIVEKCKCNVIWFGVHWTFFNETSNFEFGQIDQRVQQSTKIQIPFKLHLISLNLFYSRSCHLNEDFPTIFTHKSNDWGKKTIQLDYLCCCFVVALTWRRLLTPPFLCLEFNRKCALDYSR